MPKLVNQMLFVLCMSVMLSACTPAPDKIWQRSQSDTRTYIADIADDASFSVTSNDGETLIMWHRDEARPRFEMRQEDQQTHPLIAVDISADNAYIAAANAFNFALWDTETGELSGYWRIKQDPENEPEQDTEITSIAVSKRGDVIALGLNSGKVIIFNPRSGRRLEMLAHSDYITSLAIAPNGKYLLSGSYDGTALLWNTDTAAFVHQIVESQPIMQVALDANGKWFFTADRTNHAKVWAVASGDQQSQLGFNDRKRIFSTARFSPDGRFLITGTPSRIIEIWDVANGDRLKRIKVNVSHKQQPTSATVLAAATDPDQQTLWSENSAGIAELWQLNGIMQTASAADAQSESSSDQP